MKTCASILSARLSFTLKKTNAKLLLFFIQFHSRSCKDINDLRLHRSTCKIFVIADKIKNVLLKLVWQMFYDFTRLSYVLKEIVLKEQ